MTRLDLRAGRRTLSPAAARRHRSYRYSRISPRTILRRTAATGMARAGVQRFIVAVCSDTSIGPSPASRPYEYLNEKRVALDTWARALTAILEKKAAAPSCRSNERSARTFQDIRGHFRTFVQLHPSAASSLPPKLGFTTGYEHTWVLFGEPYTS